MEENVNNVTEGQPDSEVKNETVEVKKIELPNATTILVLGILSLIFCWCYGFVGLILGIIAVVLSTTSRKNYLSSPESYTEASFKNMNTGRICGIVGICVSALFVLLWVLFIIGLLTLGLCGAACNL